MNNNSENFDGVIEYEASLGLDNVRNNPFDEDNFYPMDGGGCRCGCCPKCERKSNAIGDKILSAHPLGGLIPTRAEMKKNRERRQARKDMRAKAKLTQAESGKIASQSLGRDSASDVALANILAQSPATEKKGMSKNTKTAIIVGSVLLVGILGYFGYKKFVKKGK